MDFLCVGANVTTLDLKGLMAREVDSRRQKITFISITKEGKHTKFLSVLHMYKACYF